MLRKAIALGCGLAAVIGPSTAWASNPGVGTAIGGGTAAISEQIEQFSIKGLNNFPVCDGYVVLLETASGSLQDPSTWSDVVMFWNGFAKPSGQCDAVQMALLSDLHDDAGADIAFPEAGTVVTVGPLVTKNIDGGSFTVSVSDIINGATGDGGTNATQTVVEPLTAPETVVYDAGIGLDDAGNPLDGGKAYAYTITSDADGGVEPPNVPALPGWAAMLLGVTLLVPGAYFLRRAHSGGSAAT